MQQGKTKIAKLRWHSNTRYRNGLKWLQITWENIPVEQTSSLLNCLLFPSYLFGSWQRISAGDPLKIHIDSDIVSHKGENEVWECVCFLCVWMCAGSSFHGLGSCCRGKCWLLITRETWLFFCLLAISHTGWTWYRQTVGTTCVLVGIKTPHRESFNGGVWRVREIQQKDWQRASPQTTSTNQTAP